MKIPKINIFNWHSMGFKLGIYVLLSTVLATSSMGYFFYQTLIEETEIEISNQLSTKVQEIDQYLQKSELSLRTLGAGVQTLYNSQKATLDDYQNLVFNNFKQRPEFLMALGIGQTSHALVADREWFWPYYYIDQNKENAVGKRLPPPNQHIGYADLGPKDEYFERDYYTEPMERKTDFWSETYDWYGVVMTSYLLPVRDKKGNIIAIGGADVSVTAIESLLQDSVINEDGYYILLSATNKLLVHPKKDKKVIENEYSLLKHWKEELIEDKIGLLRYQGSFWAYEYIPSTQWLMFAKIPKSTIRQPIIMLVVQNIIGASVVLLLLVLGFVYRFNQRLQTLVNQCNKMTHNEQKRFKKWSKLTENLDTEQPNIPVFIQSRKAKNDELNLLSQAFSTMENQLSNSLKVLENHAHTLKDQVAQRTDNLNQLNITLAEQAESLRDARDLANQANIEKSRFIANMSHELRTPLNVIMGYCELLIEVKEDEDEEDIDVADLYKIHSAATHLLGLVNDVLNISKIESGKMELYCQSISIDELIEDIKINIIPLSAVKNNKFLVENNSEYQKIFIDETKFKQILLNLLSNSTKFTENGTISLIIESRTVNQQDSICFMVMDTGIGISKIQQKKLFQPFMQADASTVRKYGGTGLGLTISKHFTEMMYGTISLTSELGKGACFAVCFPLNLADKINLESTNENQINT